MNDEDDTVSETAAAGFLAAQRELMELSALDLDRRYIQQPDRTGLTFGAGQPAEQSILGNQQHQFYGVTVLNPTSKTVFVGFESGSAQGSTLICPPYSGMTWPAKYTQLSLAVGPTDAEGAQGKVTVLRLQAPPEPNLFPYARPLSPEAWGEEEQNEGAETIATIATPAGRRRTVQNITAMCINTAAVGAPKVLAVAMKSKGTTVFRGFLQQSKTEGVGGVDRFYNPVNIPLAPGEAATLTCEAGSAGVRVVLSMSGIIE